MLTSNSRKYVQTIAIFLVLFVFINISIHLDLNPYRYETDNYYKVTDDDASSTSEVYDVLGVPIGESPPNLPAEESAGDGEKVQYIRDMHGYGGKGDQKHLGGFTDLDTAGISPSLWKHMMEYFGVKTLLDVGCGRGVSTSWFHLQGVKATCVEGSKDARSKNLLIELISEDGKNPSAVDERYIEHDYTRGPWWPSETVDAVWSVEFLEHVSRNYQKNYIATFKKAAYIFVTHSNWGGWHHTEVHSTEWWINRLEMYGFKYSENLTKNARNIAKTDSGTFPTGGKYHPSHIIGSLMVFVNPAVAGRPEHAHMLSEPGCYNEVTKTLIQCGTEPNKRSREVNTPLPDTFKPIPYNNDKHLEWESLLKYNVEKKS